MHPLRRPRAIAAFTALVVGGLSVGSAGAGHRSDVCRTPGQVEARYDGWLKLIAPTFPVGVSSIEHFVTGAGTLWVSNGAALMTSVDGGCAWSAALVPTPPDPPAGFAAPEITSFSVALEGDQQRVSVALLDTPAVAAIPIATVRTMHSVDAGRTWSSGGSGIPPATRVTSIAASPHSPEQLAAVVEGGPLHARQVFLSANSGASWRPSTSISPPPDLRSVEFDTSSASVLWGWGPGGLVRSTDLGETFSPVQVTGAVRTFVQRLGTTTRVAYTDGAEYTSVDGGTTWKESRPRIPSVDAAAVGRLSGGIVTASATEVVLAEPGQVPRRVTPFGGERIRHVSMTETADDTTLYAVARAGIFRAFPAPGLGVNRPPVAPVVPPIPPLYLEAGRDADIGTAAIRPVEAVHRLNVGESKKIRYDVELPAAPTPLDVYFLVDTTPSMAEEIDSLRRQLGTIVNALEAEGIDAHFGVGAYRDYPGIPETGVGGGGNYAYQRIRSIGPVDAELELALFNLRTGGGTSDNRVSALAALFQTATGAGQHVIANELADPYSIPKGLDAEFRPNSLRVVLHASDSGIRAARTGYPGPSLDAAATALVGQRILQLGLVTGPPDTVGTPGPELEMLELARRTNALAPDDIDCNGDGGIDVGKGDPLVCFLGGAGIDDAILGLLHGVRDEAPVRLDVSGDPRVVTPLSPLEIDNVNLKRASRLGFELEITCPPGLGAARHQLGLSAQTRGASLVGTTAVVQCIAPDVLEVIPPVTPRVAVAIVLAPLPPPPAPIVNPHPLPNTNLQPIAQPNVNIQVGMGAQEQEQPQLALATEDNVEGRTELAMSDRRDNAAPVLLFGCALALCAASAWALRHQSRTARIPV